MRRLLAEGLERWRLERAFEKLASGEVTFTRAAESAGVSVREFVRLAREHDVTWVSADHAVADLEDL